MKSKADVSWREYPHVVEFRQGRNARHAMFLSNDDDPLSKWALYAFTDRRLLGADGALLPIGRDVVLQGMLRETRNDPSYFCIVWGPHDCTYLMADGGTIAGRRPPLGEAMEAESYLDTPIELVDCRYVELPAGSASSHICVVGLTRDRVEIASGAPIVLGLWDEPVPPGRVDPVADHLDDEGAFLPPLTFRGQPVTGIDDDRILGPVQPDGRAFQVVKPWPGEVAEACRLIAGCPLPHDVLAAVWRAVDPVRWDVNEVGIRLAA